MRARQKVLLVGWDAADWKVIHPLMDAGRMPNLQRLVQQGTMGQIATLRPPLSPMLWTSIATGKRPFKHGIHGFAEPTPDGLGIRPVTNLSRRSKAIWNILNQSGLRSIVIGWWPSHPAEPINGVMISNHFQHAGAPLENGWPLALGCVHPIELRETLAGLRFHPDELVPDMVQPFIPLAREIDQDKDRRMAGCMKTLCECVSIHSAATWLMDNQSWDFFAVYYDAIDHFCHGFMQYHPPRQEHVPEKDFELYSNVVSMAYQFHDQMLGTLLDKAGDAAVILVSDHGFHPDHLRPKGIPMIPAGPAIEHRNFGILAMHGPGIRKDELLHGSSILDVTPTILTLYGLPVGEDMDGKVLVGAFDEIPEVRRIPTWEEAPGEDGQHPPHTRLDPVAARESLEQLIALGYIASPDEDVTEAVAETIGELRYNLAQSYQDADRHREALEIFRQLHRADPDEQRYAVHRFVSCQALGLLDEMREIAGDLGCRRRQLYDEALARLRALRELVRRRLEERNAQDNEAKAPEAVLSPEERQELARCRQLARYDPAVADYLKAQVRAAEGRHAEALELLQLVRETDLARPGLFVQTARLFMKLRRWDEAEQTYEKAVRVDPDNYQAYAGKSQLAIRRRDFVGAAQAALNAIQRVYHYPMAHFLLGTSLIGLREFSRAAEAFRAALALNPNFPQAHLRLAWLLRRLGDTAGAGHHLRLFRELKSGAANAAGAHAVGREESPPEPQVGPALEPSAQAPADLIETIVVVSGLPRSGTSMLMQMLCAGGLPVLSDGLREADDDNPLGYFEYEPVKYLYQNADCMKDARGRAVKVVAPLLPYLPNGHQYCIVFIERDLDEVLDSQARMIARRNENIEDSTERRVRLKGAYARQVQTLKVALAGRFANRVLFLNHAEVLRDPNAAAESLNSFLGGQLKIAEMARRVQPALHRQRIQ